MIKISNNGIILMSRGDNISLPLFINQGTRMRPIRYSLLSNHRSELYVGIMMPHQEFELALVRKKYTYESKHTPQRDVLLELLPQDTMYLLQGKYYIEAKLRIFSNSGEERIFTVLPKKMIYIY